MHWRLKIVPDATLILHVLKEPWLSSTTMDEAIVQRKIVHPEC